MPTETWKKFETVHNFLWGTKDPLNQWFIDSNKNDKSFQPIEYTDWGACMGLVEKCKELLTRLESVVDGDELPGVANMGAKLHHKLWTLSRYETFNQCVLIIEYYKVHTGEENYVELWG